ncbi:hypothetical protein NMG60_11031021 [Bertholletia excelsa]
MKNTNTGSSAAVFLKHIISMLCSMTKAKSVAIRDKTNALKARLVVLSLMKQRKFSLGAISHKFQAILGHQEKRSQEDEEREGDQSKAIVLYNASAPSSSSSTQAQPQMLEDQDSAVQEEYQYYGYYNEDDDKYPDLRHSLFEEEDDELDLGDPNASVIDLVRNSKEEGEEFRLEDEIDQVADLFIMKFHKRIRLQKLESFKRYQEMLQRSV